MPFAKTILRVLCNRMEFLQVPKSISVLLSSQDKEVECGGPAPRVLSLDDYFITEVEKEERDPDTGKKVKKKVLLIQLLILTKKQDTVKQHSDNQNFSLLLWKNAAAWGIVFQDKSI